MWLGNCTNRILICDCGKASFSVWLLYEKTQIPKPKSEFIY